MSPALLEQGLELMYYGMGTVIVFLSLLVVVTSLMSSLAQRFELVEAPVSPKASRAGATSSGPSPTVVAAISAAVHEHRKQSPR